MIAEQMNQEMDVGAPPVPPDPATSWRVTQWIWGGVFKSKSRDDVPALFVSNIGAEFGQF